MVSCAACGCSQTAKNTCMKVTFHCFPKDVRRKAWIDFVGNPDWVIRSKSVLCSYHFTKDCFDRSSQLKVRLLPTAVPTIQVDRLKYVRKFNSVVLKPANDVGQNEAQLGKVPEVNNYLLAVPAQPVSETLSVTSPKTLPKTPPRGSSVAKRASSEQQGPVGSNEFQDTPRKKKLKRIISELHKVDILKSHKIRKLQKLAWRQKKQILSLKSMTCQLKKKNLMLEEQESILLEHFGANQEIIQRLFQKTQKKVVRKKFEQSVRAFAVTLHFFSPRAYNFVRQKFYNCLPHPKTLSKWYSSVDAKPGFTSEALQFLKCKVAHCDNKPLLCSLVFDEIAIRQHLEYSGDRYYGYVDCGNELHGDGVALAKEALVFMVVCINERWKLPIGYFFISGINSEQKASLTRQALTLLKDAGIVITNITFDGCAANFSMCNLFNCRFSKTNIKADFIFDNTKYFLLPDPVHMVKLIRNCFGEKKKILDGSGNIIDFEYLVKLNDLQEREGLHLGNKLRNQHIRFFKQKMKVKLATQLLSQSVSEALLFCRDQLELQEFKNCGPTAKFIKIINDAFDALNSHKVSDYGFKKAVCSTNIEKIRAFFETFRHYIIHLKFTDGMPVLDSQRKSGFVGMLMGFAVVLGMYDEYVAKGALHFIPTYKLNQDHLELFFGTVRSQGGHNNNPTCRQFTAAYKKILIHAEVRDGGAGNCIPLEEINILNVNSNKKPPDQIINESIPNRIIETDDQNENNLFTDNFLMDHDYALNFDSLSPYSLEVTSYIAGFVAFKLGRKLQCEHCISQLFGEKEKFFGSLIHHKSRGGLSYPSDDLIKICTICEKFLRIQQIQNKKIDKCIVSSRVLSYFIDKNIFSEMVMHGHHSN